MNAWQKAKIAKSLLELVLLKGFVISKHVFRNIYKQKQVAIIVKSAINDKTRVSAEKVKIICFVFLANFFVLGHTLGNLDLK